MRSCGLDAYDALGMFEIANFRTHVLFPTSIEEMFVFVFPTSSRTLQNPREEMFEGAIPAPQSAGQEAVSGPQRRFEQRLLRENRGNSTEGCRTTAWTSPSWGSKNLIELVNEIFLHNGSTLRP